MHRVFVYGTLKRGFPNHDEWMGGAALLGACRTVEAFPLLIGGPWFTIQMLPEPGRGLRVCGELYEVDDERLLRLDRLENLAEPDGYTRQQITVEDDNGRLFAGVWAYFKDRGLVDPVHEGPLASYELDPRYVPARLRFEPPDGE